MKTKEHIIYSTIFVAILFFIFDDVRLFEAFIIWISSWFIIDLDHAIRYSLKTGNYNPKRFMKWSSHYFKQWIKLDKKEKKQYKMQFFAFHGIEVMVILLILSQFYPIFTYVFVGFFFHHVCDWIDLLRRRDNLMQKTSLFYVLWYNSKKTRIRTFDK